MRTKDLLADVKKLRNQLTKVRRELGFTYEVREPSEPFKTWCDQWRRFLPEHASGVYIFHHPLGEPIYIGKASQDNMGNEVWNKLKNFKINSRGEKEFDRTPFLSGSYPGMTNGLRQSIRKGEIYISALVVSPGPLSSLIEVYLQTAYCLSVGRLPVLNRRIG